MKEFEAVVFDMDGVIFDSEKKNIECWKEVAAKYNIPNIEETCKKCLGVNVNAATKIMYDEYGEDFDYVSYRKETSDLFHSRYDGGKLPLKEGVLEILGYLKARNIKIALASSTREIVVRQELAWAGIIEYFDKIVCGDMVEKSKPEPDIFLKACEELGVEPQRSYAIEDSFNGIRSAHAAQMHPIMVPDILQPSEEIRSLSEVVLDSLNEVIAYFDK